MVYEIVVEYVIEILFLHVFELLFVYMLKSGHDVFRCRTLCHNEDIVICSKITSCLLGGGDV